MLLGVAIGLGTLAAVIAISPLATVAWPLGAAAVGALIWDAATS